MADILALTGFMGCGKSTVAAILAERSCGFYFDLDDTIQMEEGRSISEIFASDGQNAFRDLEYKYLERIISDYGDFDQKIIIALGGGTVTSERCAALIKQKCKCVYLRASGCRLVENLEEVGIENRPLLRDALSDDGSGITHDALVEKVDKLLESRREIYEKCADFTIDTDGLSFEKIADAVASVC